MKNTFVLIIIGVFISSTMDAQNIPVGEWRKEYSFFPAEINDTLFSGDEWFYDHEVITGEDGTKTGYIAAGYTSKPNLFIDETSFETPGCHVHIQPPASCDDFETDDLMKGSLWPIVAMVNQKGDLMASTRLGMRGEYSSVIQLSSGEYIAVGQTESTRCTMDNSSTKIYYNFGRDGNTSNFFDPQKDECNTFLRRRGLITKFDKNLKILWNHIYSPATFQEDVDLGKPLNTTFNDVAETVDGSIIAVGFSSFFSSRGYVLKVDSEGHWISSHNISYSEEEPDFVIRSTIYSYENEEENLYLGGERFLPEQELPGIMKLDFTNSNPFQIWRYNNINVEECFPDWENGVAVTSMALSNNGKSIRIPIVLDGEDGQLRFNNRGKNGKAIIEELDVMTGLSMNSSLCDITIPEKIIANDVRMGITNTQDGGYAVVSSIRFEDPYIPDTVIYELCVGQDLDAREALIRNVWETDAYIVKFTAENMIEWEKDFDSASSRQSGDTSTWNYPSILHDVKLQECLYSITEDDDGQLTIAGNTSTNFDDSYMARVCNASLKNVIAGEVEILIDNEVRTYIGNDNIKSTGVRIVNNSNVSFKSGSQIEIKPITNNTSSYNEFHVESGSVFHAKIYDNLNCAPEEETGFFKTAFEDNDGLTTQEYPILSTSSNETEMKLYPNPVDDILNLEFEDSSHREITVFDINGKFIFRKNTSEAKVQLNVDQLSQGIYFVSIFNTNSSSKIVKRIVIY